MPWATPLTKPISLKDGRVLRTLGDAAELFLNFSETIHAHPWVEHAADLLMKAAESKDKRQIRAATTQVQRALSREGMV